MGGKNDERNLSDQRCSICSKRGNEHGGHLSSGFQPIRRGHLTTQALYGAPQDTSGVSILKEVKKSDSFPPRAAACLVPRGDESLDSPLHLRGILDCSDSVFHSCPHCAFAHRHSDTNYLQNKKHSLDNNTGFLEYAYCFYVSSGHYLYPWKKNFAFSGELNPVFSSWLFSYFNAKCWNA